MFTFCVWGAAFAVNTASHNWFGLLRTTVVMYPFFTLGVWYSRYEKIRRLMNESSVLYAGCLIAYIALFAYSFTVAPCKADNYLTMAPLPIRPANYLPFLAIVVLLQLFIRHERQMPRFLATIGQYTMEIYVIHWFFLPTIGGLAPQVLSKSLIIPFMSSFVAEAFASLIMALPVVLCSVWLGRALRDNRYLALLCLGIKNK